MTENPTNSASGIAVVLCEYGAGYGGAEISQAAFLKELPAKYSPHLYTALATPPYQQLARLGASIKPKPFGRTFLEGMALGKAVIASNEGGPLDVIEHGVDGLLITPRDPSILSAAVLRPLDDPALAAWLGHNAARKARNHSIKNILRRSAHSCQTSMCAHSAR